MKKIVILLLAIMMCVACVACGNDAEKADKYCWNCGKGLASEDSFCSACGENVEYNMSEESSSVFSEGLLYHPNNTKTGYIVEDIGICNDLKVVLPSQYQSLPVTEIGVKAFYKCSSLKVIIIPDSVTSIGRNAFALCPILTSITIPDSVTSIGNNIFSNCHNLKSIHFQGTVEEWNAIEKGSDWDGGTGSYTIYCTDGEIAK